MGASGLLMLPGARIDPLANRDTDVLFLSFFFVSDHKGGR